jgi:hypothetical protein
MISRLMPIGPPQSMPNLLRNARALRNLIKKSIGRDDFKDGNLFHWQVLAKN